MARIRTIKPDFFTSEDIVGITPLARLLYIATWLEADREGRFVWRPKTLKLRYLPGDQCDIDAIANELVSSGLVVPYDVDGQTFAEIPTFARHQVINNRESASAIPARDSDASGTPEQRVTDVTATPLMGKERKGKEVDRTRRVEDEQVEESFAQFWERYPAKKGKQDAIKAWRKLKPSGDLLIAIMSGLEAQKAARDWRKDDGRYIPHPATWLNGRRWDDELGTDQPIQAVNSLFAGAV